jgi:hypothetical protein
MSSSAAHRRALERPLPNQPSEQRLLHLDGVTIQVPLTCRSADEPLGGQVSIHDFDTWDRICKLYGWPPDVCVEDLREEILASLGSALGGGVVSISLTPLAYLEMGRSRFFADPFAF